MALNSAGLRRSIGSRHGQIFRIPAGGARLLAERDVGRQLETTLSAGAARARPRWLAVFHDNGS